MKKIGRRNTFDVDEMLALRRVGWTFTRLAQAYEVDHSTIIYHCQKHKVEPETDVRIGVARPGRGEKKQRPSVKKVPPPEKPVKLSKYEHLFNDPINPGKPYSEYMKQEKARPKDTTLRPWIKNYMAFTHVESVKTKPKALSINGPRRKTDPLPIEDEVFADYL